MKQSLVELIEMVRDKGGVVVEVSTDTAIDLGAKLSRVKHDMKEKNWRISVRSLPAFAEEAKAGCVRIRIERKDLVRDECIEIESMTVLEDDL